VGEGGGGEMGVMDGGWLDFSLFDLIVSAGTDAQLVVHLPMVYLSVQVDCCHCGGGVPSWLCILERRAEKGKD
jgi:hypothetical protein